MVTRASNDETPSPNIMIAVMGATGSGKSTFIHTLTGRGDENMEIGLRQESWTDQVKVSAYFDPDNKCYVTLIDTPGFDDSCGLSDTDILRKIMEFLQHNGGQKLHGLIYMHRISDLRMCGISRSNLRLFRQLCHDDTLTKVCVVTTNWGRVSKEGGAKRERELRESPNLFKPLVDEGAQLARHDKGMTSAQSIVNYLIHKDPAKLQIPLELDAFEWDSGETAAETISGTILKNEILALKTRHEVEFRALREEMDEAAKECHAEVSAGLEEELQKMKERIQNLEDDLKSLKAQAQSDKEKHDAEICALKEQEQKCAADCHPSRPGSQKMGTSDPQLAPKAKSRNIIFFGATGAGKSSLVNMLTGLSSAQVGNNAIGVTLSWTKHSTVLFDTKYQIFDTAGLNEGEKGMVKGKDAIINLFQLVESLKDGVNLLVFCMRGRITKTTADNYRLFYQIFCDGKVPIVLVVTGLEELDNVQLRQWWSSNEISYEKYGMKFAGCVCGTATKGKREMYTPEYDATNQRLRDLIHGSALDIPWQKPRETWLSGIIRIAAKLLPNLFGPISRSFQIIYDALISVGGYSRAEAQEIARKAM